MTVWGGALIQCPEKGEAEGEKGKTHTNLGCRPSLGYTPSIHAQPRRIFTNGRICVSWSKLSFWEKQNRPTKDLRAPTPPETSILNTIDHRELIRAHRNNNTRSTVGGSDIAWHLENAFFG